MQTPAKPTPAVPKAEQRPSLIVRYQGKIPRLFLIWIVLSVIAPHPDLYKAWFHLAMGLPVLVLFLIGKLQIDTRDTLFRVLSCMVLYAAISSVLISHADLSLHLQTLRWCLETFALLLTLFLALPPLFKRPLFLARFFLTCTLIGCAASIMMFGVLHHFSGRLTGIGALYQPIEAVSAMIIYLCIGAFLLWHERHATGWKDQALLFAALLLTTACTLLSESRGPTLALVLTAVYCFFIGALAHRHWKTLAIASLSIVAAVGGVLWLYGFENFLDAMTERGTSYRLLLWSTHFQNPPDSLLFGHGSATDLMSTIAGQKIQATGLATAQPHNLFIGVFVQTGLVGVALLLLAFGLILKHIINARTCSAAKLYMLGLLGLIIMLVTTNTYTIIISAKTIWLYTWLPLLFLWLWCRHTHNAGKETPKSEALAPGAS